jgi:hypothetical protein
VTQIESQPIATAEVKHVARDPPGVDERVEAALARALEAAAEAGRFDVVAQIARELEARRLAATDGKVAPLAANGRREPQRG